MLTHTGQNLLGKHLGRLPKTPPFRLHSGRKGGKKDKSRFITLTIDKELKKRPCPGPEYMLGCVIAIETVLLPDTVILNFVCLNSHHPLYLDMVSCTIKLSAKIPVH